jgi:hypothetical protein
MRRLVVQVAVVAAALAASSCTTTTTGATPDAAPVITPCEEAGGQCGASACSALGPQSCGATGGACCLDALGAACAAEGGSSPIAASSYDQSCQVDSDCVAIGIGDPCYPCEVLCPGTAAINASSMAQYTADVARSPSGSGRVACSCPLYDPASVCCNAGRCAPHCLAPLDGGSVDGDSVDGT